MKRSVRVLGLGWPSAGDAEPLHQALTWSLGFRLKGRAICGYMRYSTALAPGPLYVCCNQRCYGGLQGLEF